MTEKPYVERYTREGYALGQGTDLERWQSPVYCSCLESSRSARARGFESLPLRYPSSSSYSSQVSPVAPTRSYTAWARWLSVAVCQLSTGAPSSLVRSAQARIRASAAP